MRFGSASLPARWELSRLGSADGPDVLAVQSAATAFLTGSDSVQPVARFFASSRIRAVAPGQPATHVASVTLPRGVKARLALDTLQLLNLSQGLASWQLVLNPVFEAGAQPAFSAQAPGALAVVSEDSARVVPGSGAVLASGRVTKVGPQHEVLHGLPDLGLDATGTADVVSLLVTGLRGVVTLTASLSWLETE